MQFTVGVIRHFSSELGLTWNYELLSYKGIEAQLTETLVPSLGGQFCIVSSNPINDPWCTDMDYHIYF